VALVLGGADDGARAGARAGLAGVAAGAGVNVVAGRAVGLGGVGAGAGRGVALTGVVALVRRRAHDRRAGGARAALAGITDRARIAIVTRAAVRPGGIRALAGRRVAGARVVALVLRGADDGVRPGAGPGLAGVAAGARVVVVAAGRVRRVDAAGHGGAGIVRARVAVVAVRRWTTDASPARARVARGASVPVVTSGRVRAVHTARRRVTDVVGAGVPVVATGR